MAGETSVVASNLVYVDASQPGIVRVKKGKGFAYRLPDGQWLQSRNPEHKCHLTRIRSLAIPPAYEAVWICLNPLGHLQAIGRDAKGRKQYRYHPEWQQLQDQNKFDRMLSFGLSLPALRQQVQKDLASRAAGLRRHHVLAAVVRLLDTTLVRVGNEVYAKENQSYGLTTLRNRHVQVEGPVIQLRFRGKSGVWHKIKLHDPKVARIVKRCQSLPGQELFEYQDEEGQLRVLGSMDVNEYIREASKGDFTAKDFRTWHATVQATALLHPDEMETVEGELVPSAVQRIKQALATVAKSLGNTVAVCRKSYVHPLVISWAQQQQWPLIEGVTVVDVKDKDHLNSHECRLLHLLHVAATS